MLIFSALFQLLAVDLRKESTKDCVLQHNASRCALPLVNFARVALLARVPLLRARVRASRRFLRAADLQRD